MDLFRLEHLIEVLVFLELKVHPGISEMLLVEGITGVILLM